MKKSKSNNWEREFDKEDGKFYRVVTTLPPDPTSGRIGINSIKDEIKSFIKQLLKEKKQSKIDLIKRRRKMKNDDGIYSIDGNNIWKCLKCDSDKFWDIGFSVIDLDHSYLKCINCKEIFLDYELDEKFG